MNSKAKNGNEMKENDCLVKKNEDRAGRILESAVRFCDLVLPKSIETEFGVKRSELFKLDKQVGASSILMEVDSPYSKVKSMIIGKNGANIRAIRSLLISIGKQERFNLIDISVIN